MAETIVPSDPETVPLEKVDEGLEMILEGITLIKEVLPDVRAYTEDQNNAKKHISETVERALMPYTVEIYKALEAFEEV